MSDSTIAAGLEDDDVQNVQLAARYLGSFKSKDAAPRLEQVAQGYGHGSREIPARVEAISALAKIGAPSSGAVLRELAQKRGLFGGCKDREVREAAVEALQVYEATVSGQGVA
jgi:HEAT repeat protein